MPQNSLLYLDPHNVEHTSLIIEALNMSNDWEPEKLATTYLETGISNLRRWNAELIILRDAQEPLARAAWYAKRNPELIGFAEINFVHTAEQHTKQGYGALVVHAAEDRAREQGFQCIGLSSFPSAVPFYKAIGYKDSSDGIRGRGLPWMTKDLKD